MNNKIHEVLTEQSAYWFNEWAAAFTARTNTCFLVKHANCPLCQRSNNAFRMLNLCEDLLNR